MKRLKLKSNSISLGKMNRIIFDEPKLQSGYHPNKWFSNKTKFKRNDYSYLGFTDVNAQAQKMNNSTSYYKGKYVGKKKSGYGTEIITQNGNWLPNVVSFYNGYWKNNKKNGNGYWSNHHPKIGETTSHDGANPTYSIINLNNNENNECSFSGFWSNDYMIEGVFEFAKGVFRGKLKNNRFYNGKLIFWDFDNQPYKKGKRIKSNIEMEIKKSKFIKNKYVDEFNSKHNVFWQTHKQKSPHTNERSFAIDKEWLFIKNSKKN
tara:strand:- start:139 stop:924 length:786 start_codon:yes stop_codon:yes gene_type:complete